MAKKLLSNFPRCINILAFTFRFMILSQCGFISAISMLFVWSAYLSFCQYYPSLITMKLYYFLKSSSVNSPIYFSFFKISFLGILYFHTHFGINLPVSKSKTNFKNPAEIVIGVAFNLQISLGKHNILTILSFPIYWCIFLFWFRCSLIFSQLWLAV